MNSSAIGLLFLLPQVLHFAFWTGMFFFLISRRKQYPGPATYASVAAAIHILMLLVSVASMFIAPRFFGASNMQMVFGSLSFVTVLGGMTAATLMVKAIFKDRDRRETVHNSQNVGVPLAERTDDNPYASP